MYQAQCRAFFWVPLAVSVLGFATFTWPVRARCRYTTWPVHLMLVVDMCQKLRALGPYAKKDLFINHSLSPILLYWNWSHIMGTLYKKKGQKDFYRHSGPPWWSWVDRQRGEVMHLKWWKIGHAPFSLLKNEEVEQQQLTQARKAENKYKIHIGSDVQKDTMTSSATINIIQFYSLNTC